MHSLPNVSFCIYAKIFTSIPNLPFKDFVSINTHLCSRSLKLKSMERRNEWGDDSIGKKQTWGSLIFTKRKDASGLQMDLHCEVQIWWIIGKIQGKTCRQRVHSNLWCRLPWDICTSDKDEYHHNSFIFGYHQGLLSTSIWYEKCIPSWRFRRRGL